jgi:hypothetical protein
MNATRHRHIAVPAFAALALLAACAGLGGPALQVGQTQADVSRILGNANAQHVLPTGATRLEFARGPMGRETWMVDLDTSGRVSAWMQALEEPRLHALQARAPGMAQSELLRTLGRPADRRRVGWRGDEVWAWRYVTNECQWFEVTLGADQRVREAGFGIDPLCDHRRDAVR